MAETRSEGSTFTSKSAKSKGGEERQIGSELGRTGRFAQHSYPDNAYPISVSSGRTISTGRFAFARIGFTIEARVVLDEASRAEAYECMEGIVTQVLSREEAALRGEEPEPLSIDEPEGMFARVIRFEYGLTIPFPNFESRKIDVGIHEPVDDGESMEDAIERAQKWILERLDQKQLEVGKADETDTDYGI